MKRGLLIGVLFLVAAPSVQLYADLRMVIRESSWGGKRRDTAVVWETVALHQTSARIARSYSSGRGFVDTTALVPNYTDSVYYWMLPGRKYFCRSLARDSAVLSGGLFALTLSGGTLQEKFLTDRKNIAGAACEHRQWVWAGCSLDSAAQKAGTADLELDFWLPVKGFLGKEDLEYFNQFRRKNFGGRKLIVGIEGARISTALGVRLVELERKLKSSSIFPLEAKVTLRRKLANRQRDYRYVRQVVELHADRQDALDYMIPTGYERVKSEKPNATVRGKKK